jgi:hypothetical protein
MRLKLSRGDKSSFPTTIVMMVPGSAKQQRASHQAEAHFPALNKPATWNSFTGNL